MIIIDASPNPDASLFTKKMSIKSPVLKYYGSKFRLASWIISHFPDHWPYFWHYVDQVCKPRSPQVLFACGKFVNKLINTNPKHYRYDLIWEKNLAVGFLDENRKPLRAHESILFFSKEFRGSTYNPQMIEGKAHTRSKGICKARHYSTPTKIMPGVKTNLYHPRSVLKFNNRTAGP